MPRARNEVTGWTFYEELSDPDNRISANSYIAVYNHFSFIRRDEPSKIYIGKDGKLDFCAVQYLFDYAQRVSQTYIIDVCPKLIKALVDLGATTTKAQVKPNRPAD